MFNSRVALAGHDRGRGSGGRRWSSASNCVAVPWKPTARRFSHPFAARRARQAPLSTAGTRNPAAPDGPRAELGGRVPHPPGTPTPRHAGHR